MSGLLARLKTSGTAICSVQMKDVTLGLRILSDRDYLEADLAVLAFMKQQGVAFSAESADTFENEKSTQLLLRALVDPVSGDRLARDITDMREAISREQKAYLIEQYLEHEKQCAPKEESMPEEEFAALLEEVKKKPGQTVLSGLNTVTLKKLILSLASPPAT